jgi:hypothetical protein
MATVGPVVLHQQVAILLITVPPYQPFILALFGHSYQHLIHSTHMLIVRDGSTFSKFRQGRLVIGGRWFSILWSRIVRRSEPSY